MATFDIFDAANTTDALVRTGLGGADHTNAEPVHDDAEDFDAEDCNNFVRALAALARRTRPGNLVNIAFELSTTPGTATTAIPLMGSALAAWLAHVDGTLVGITGRFETALTAGTAVIEPKIAGVATTFTAAFAALGQKVRARQLPGAAAAADIIDAGDLDELTVEVTTNGATWAGADKLNVFLTVSCGEEEAV